MCYNGIGSVLKKILLKGDRKSWKSHLAILKIKLLPDLWYLASLGYDIAIINLARAIWLKKKAFFDLVIMTFPKHKLIDPIKFPWTGANKYSRNGGSYFKWFRQIQKKKQWLWYSSVAHFVRIFNKLFVSYFCKGIENKPTMYTKYVLFLK